MYGFLDGLIGDEEESSLSEGYYANLNRKNKAERAIARFALQAEEREDFTPDFIDLKTQGADLYPVFVYGEDKEGFTMEHLTENCVFFGEAVSCLENYLLFRNKGFGPKAILLDYDQKVRENLGYYVQASKKIVGELYGVPLHKLCALDKYHQNSILTERSKMMVSFESEQKIQNGIRRSYNYTQAFYWNGRSNVLKHRPQNGQGSISLAGSTYLHKLQGKQVFEYFE